MKISTLLKREPFKKIFEKTLSNFLTNYFNTEFKIVHLSLTELIYKKKRDQQNWFCNPLINSIFVKDINPESFRSINGEYNKNPSKPLKSILQTIYLRLSQTYPFSVFFSRYVIRISPPLKNSKSKLIIGGNNKIRLIDIKNNKVFVILKDGFHPDYINREIFIRDNFSYIPTSTILERNINQNWYSEEYIEGLPPNRLSASEERFILNEANKNIHQLLRETEEKSYFKGYVLKILNQIKDNLISSSNIFKKEKDSIEEILNSLKSILDKKSDHIIHLGLTHGDYHQGNILYNTSSKKYWIMDWEHSEIRQSSYDLFILLLGSRVDKGYSSRFMKLLDKEVGDFNNEIAKNWPYSSWNNDEHRIVKLLIFLLEDLAFQIREKSNPIFIDGAGLIRPKIAEYNKIIKDLENY